MEEVNEVMESLKIILDFKLISDKDGKKISLNDLVQHVSESTYDITELIDDAQTEMTDREKLIFLRDLGATIDKSNKGVLEIISELLGIVRTMLHKRRMAEESESIADIKQQLDDSIEEIERKEKRDFDDDNF